MNAFHFKENKLFAENVLVQTIAEQVGTPCYIYAKSALEQNYLAFTHNNSNIIQVHYAVKANSNLAVLNVLANLGAGFDVVSVGELERVLAAKGNPKKIVFSGVGKTEVELERALEVGVGCINIESLAELYKLNALALKKNKKAPIAFRINPDVDAESHPYISTGLKENKFGIEVAHTQSYYQEAAKLSNIEIKGIACHIGSQIETLKPFLNALDKLLSLISDLKKMGITLTHLNLGGGLGVRYRTELLPSIADYVNAILGKLTTTHKEIQLHLEPGRAICANAGILLTKVEYLKKQASLVPEKYFAITDAGMNDLLRPALYNAWQDIIPLHQDAHTPKLLCDVVGPVCETADFLGKDRLLSIAVGEYLAITGSGAYGFSMSSNYNSRPRAAEVLVEGSKFHVIRTRETVQALFQNELIP